MDVEEGWYDDALVESNNDVLVIDVCYVLNIINMGGCSSQF